ncbi:hypothetical protein K431DRAFT_282849 [Polychaeton citri CBS 116435]|uniref:Secreted protein n=1 Tax=Polychaeton citri CBS 116435 TaxID=1314669 RepID=A0A9P4UPS7_9PEZI|nr:hypothetical protein K431DRAFT_282849 [Polychaeton citri CBS 116435]
MTRDRRLRLLLFGALSIKQVGLHPPPVPLSIVPSASQQATVFVHLLSLSLGGAKDRRSVNHSRRRRCAYV